MRANIQVKGAWASLYGAETEHLAKCLTVLDPKRFYNSAFRERRWDGRVRLYEGRTFPSGLTPRVVEHLEHEGIDVAVIGYEDKKPVDLSRLTLDYMAIPGPGGKMFDEMWEHQLEAVKALLSNKRGVVKSPTASGKTAIMAVVARYLFEERGWTSLVVVPKKGLLHQTAEYFERCFHGELVVGVCGDSKKTCGVVTVGTAQTLIGFKPRRYRYKGKKTEKATYRYIPADENLRHLIKTTDVLFLDECLTGDARVWTTDGIYLLSDPALLSKKAFAFDALTGKLEPREVKRWLRKGRKRVYELILSNGVYVKATDRTPFWTPVGWVMLKDLRRGDAVTIANAGAERGSNRISEEDTDITFLGTSVGDLDSAGRSVWHGSPWTDLCARVVAASDLISRPLGSRSMFTVIGSGSASFQGTTGGEITHLFPQSFLERFTALCWEICRFVSLTVEVYSHDLASRTGGRKDATPSGKQNFSTASGFLARLYEAAVTVPCLLLGVQNACLSFRRFIGWLGRRVKKRLPKIGLIESVRLVAPCGLWTTVQTANPTKPSRFIQRGTLHDPSSVSRLGSTTSVTDRQRSALSNNAILSSGCCHNLPGTGKSTMLNMPAHPCFTSFSEVVAIRDAGFEETFDLEVAGLHSYVANGIVCHNTHRASSDSWQDIAMYSGAHHRYGLSGTPLKDSEIADMKMIGATGPIIYDVGVRHLIDEGLAARPRIAIVMSDNASGPELPFEWTTRTNSRGVTRPYRLNLGYKEAYVQGVVENDHLNTAVVRAVCWLVEQGRQTLILTRRKEHFKRIANLLEEAGLEFRAVWGSTPTPERDDAKKLLNAGKIKVLLATVIFDEGEDVERIEGLVLAEGVKVPTNVLQRIGRGMRKKYHQEENDVWVVDFCPTNHPKLMEHARDRVRTYESESHEVLVVEAWPEKDDTEFDDKHLLPFNRWEEALAEAEAE